MGKATENNNGPIAGPRQILVNLIGDFFPFAAYLFLLAYDRIYLSGLIEISMPVRGLFRSVVQSGGVSSHSNWAGLFFFYLLPLGYGLFVAWRRSGSISAAGSPVRVGARLCFFYSMISCLPLVLLLLFPSLTRDRDSLVALGTVFVLFPTMMALGMLAGFEWKGERPRLALGRCGMSKMAWLALAVLLIAFIGLKVYLITRSSWPAGNDVFYHTSLSMRLMHGANPLDSPIMQGVPNNYAPLSHYCMALLAQLTGVSVLRLWPYGDLFCLVLLLLTLFWFFYYVSRHAWAALLGLAFLLPWDEFWCDYSSRRPALMLLPAFWLCLVRLAEGKGRKYLAYASLLLLLILAFHLLMFMVALSTGALYLIWIYKGGRIKGFLSGMRCRDSGHEGPRVASALVWKRWMAGPIPLITGMGILSVITVVILFTGLHRFPVNQMGPFSEMALGINRPFGVVTLVLLPLGFISLAAVSRGHRPGRVILLTVALLYLTVVSYVLATGDILPGNGSSAHIRVVAEIACIPLAIGASMLVMEHNGRTTRTTRAALTHRREALFMIVLVLALSSIGVYCKARFQVWYAGEVNKRMGWYGEMLSFIERLPEDAVILADPEDMINRYIPGVAGRFIYVARYSTDKNSNTVISPTIGFFGNKELQERFDLSKEFCAAPSGELLSEMERVSRFDYILAKQGGNVQKWLEANGCQKVYEDEGGYMLYRLDAPSPDLAPEQPG